MRTIHSHECDDKNNAVIIEAEPLDPNNGNACHYYLIRVLSARLGTDYTHLAFQRGPVDGAANGITDESLLAVLIDRVETMEQGTSPHPRHGEVKLLLAAAMRSLHDIAADEQRRLEAEAAAAALEAAAFEEAEAAAEAERARLAEEATAEQARLAEEANAAHSIDDASV